MFTKVFLLFKVLSGTNLMSVLVEVGEIFFCAKVGLYSIVIIKKNENFLHEFYVGILEGTFPWLVQRY